MIQNIDLKSIRKQLPYGAIVQIAKKAGVLTPTVSRAMLGDKRSPKLPDIIKATAEILAEYKTKELEAGEAFNKLININSKITGFSNKNKKAINPEDSPL